MRSPDASARDAILAAVRAARPPAVALPDAVQIGRRDPDGVSRIDAFAASAAAAGAEVVRCARGDVARIAGAAVSGAQSILSAVDGIASTIDAGSAPHDFADLEVLLFEATLGVAENGAVWIATSDASFRAALFLAQRVVVIVAEDDLVDDLHQAYAHIDVREQSFGAFVAGPSKTADIEQSLVIGAHGPKALTLVVLLAEPA